MSTAEHRQPSGFEAEVRDLDRRIAQIGGAVEDQLGEALKALAKREIAAAKVVIARDAEIDAMELEIDRATANLFSRRQLLGPDLRAVLATIKVSSAIERVGDLTKNTARRSISLSARYALPPVGAVSRLGEQTLSQFSAALDAFSQRDEALARDVWHQDEALDNLYNGLQREIIEAMASSPSQIGEYTQLMFIAKNMERIGDHATFIAEMAVYVMTGAQIGEQRPKGLPDGLLNH